MNKHIDKVVEAPSIYCLGLCHYILLFLIFRYPELVHFHFFVPEELDEKVSYYKLKVLFPHSNLELLG